MKPPPWMKALRAVDRRLPHRYRGIRSRMGIWVCERRGHHGRKGWGVIGEPLGSMWLSCPWCGRFLWGTYSSEIGKIELQEVGN